MLQDVQERWSLLKVCREAGLSEKLGRSMVRLGHLDPTDLTEHDVVAARVAAAVSATPAPGVVRGRNTEVTVSDRDTLAVLLARRAANSATTNPAARLVVTADSAKLAATAGKLVELLESFAGQPLLVLPIGTWIAELPSRRPDDQLPQEVRAA